jgi:hypothetical protein
LLRHGRKFDVWHVHQYGFHAALAVALGRALGRPVVLNLPSSGAMGIETAIGTGIFGRILRFFHLRVNACLVVSEETREEAIRFGLPMEHIHFVPELRDGRQFHAAPEERAAARCALGLDCENLPSTWDAFGGKESHRSPERLGSCRHECARGSATGTGG